MSTETLAALRTALDKHVLDEHPELVTGAFVCIVETTTLEDMDNDESTCFVVTHGNTFTCRGMIECYRDGGVADE